MGEGKRDQIHHIIGRMPADKLTQTAQAELEVIIGELISKNEAKPSASSSKNINGFVEFSR